MGTLLKHPRLGSIRSIQTHDDVVQYRGIPYGTIAKRFSKAVLAKSLSQRDDGVFDGTEFGPQSPQPPKMMEHELGLYGGQFPVPRQQPPMDEFKCLNLVVTRPKDTGYHNLPVFFWMHGGNLISGANWFPQSDATKLVARSVEAGSPIVVVAINYRMGFFALLKSAELSAEVGTNGNLCFHDQALALEWVQEYISGFGGSPANITCGGESAGAVSTQVQLLSDKPLFQKAIMMSGSLPLMGSMPDHVHESQYKDLIGALGLDSLSQAERLSKLCGGMSTEEVLAKTPPLAPFKISVDGELIKDEVSFKKFTTPGQLVATPGWCKALLAGESADDSSVVTYFTYAHWPDPGASIHAALKHFLGEDDAVKVLSPYGLHPPAPKEKAIWAIHDLIQDLGFAIPMFRIAQNWHDQKHSHFYRLAEPITWDHMFKHKVPHIWDTALLFGNFEAALSPAQNTASKDLQSRFLRFISSEEQPWPSVANNSIFVFGGSQPGESTPYQTPRFQQWDILEEVGHDRIWSGVTTGFLAAGPPGFAVE